MSSCETCGKEFVKRGGLARHKVKKIPCKKPTRLIANVVHQTLTEASMNHLEVPTTEFRDNSLQFHKTLSKEERGEQGIFFTPKKVRDSLFSELASLGVSPQVVLEPSFGTGEFLLDAKRIWPSAKIIGVEKNEKLFKSVKCPGAELICDDFLNWSGSADLVIGNPPYFVIPTDSMSLVEKKAFTKANAVCMTGRPNIYVRFLYNCLEFLVADGFLAFILPTSIFNCSYYQPMRDYICAKTTIHTIVNLNKPGFYETGQETVLLVLQKKKIHDNYVFKAGGNCYITPFYKELASLVQGTVTMAELGIGVKTGNVVWNQVKDKLSDKGTLLIYSSNLAGSVLTLGNLKGLVKKQYVKDIEKPKISGPVILCDRGYGNTLSFNTVLVTEKEFYAENHVNVIYPVTEQGAGNLERVLASLRDERVKKFVEMFSGNGMISATDLEKIIPVF